MPLQIPISFQMESLRHPAHEDLHQEHFSEPLSSHRTYEEFLKFHIHRFQHNLKTFDILELLHANGCFVLPD